MATTTHFLQAHGTNGTSTAQFQDMLTVPATKIAKVKLTSLSVQNTTSSGENYDWRAGLYVVPAGSTTEVLLDAYTAPTNNAKSHYTIYPTDGRAGNYSTNISTQIHVYQDTYNTHDTSAGNNNYESQGFVNPEFYLNAGEVLRFMWKHHGSQPNYEFFLRGFYLLEDVTA